MGGMALAGAALGAPVVAHALIRRRARAPQAPRWGRSHRFAGRHGTIAFQELGEGPPIVLLHAFGPGYDSSQWRAAAEVLARGHRVLAPDLPGWGRSEAGVLDPGFYLDAIADFLHSVVRDRPVVAAAGLPAAYAAAVAAERPELVRALALVAPLGLGAGSDGDPALWPGRATHDGRPEAGARSLVGKLLDLPLVRVSVLDLVTSHAALAHHLRTEVYAAPERVDAALLDHHYRVSHLPSTRPALAAYLRGRLRHDPSEALAELRQPVWIAWGSAALHPPLETADLWLHRLPAARLEVLSGAGSLPHAEVPALFARSLERFIRELPAPQR
jgi:pimeloyl-ACP methyl ester carboxylesterase